MDLTHYTTLQPLRWDGVDIVLVHRPECQASISLFGGQLLSYQPGNELPVLWQNPTADFSGQTAIRSGIPICWPWFNRIDINAEPVQQSFADISQPSHGPVRSQQWRLEAVEETDEMTMLRLVTELTDKALTLRVEYRLGSALDIVLTTENHGDKTLAFGCALHSYFAISAIEQVVINGLDQCQYLDMVDGMSEKRQDGYLHIEQEVDRLYQPAPSEVALVDAGWQRQVKLTTQNSQSTVVWNPWIEKCQQTSQLKDDDYRHFVCIETARAGNDYVELGAGEQQQLQLSIRTQSL